MTQIRQIRRAFVRAVTVVVAVTLAVFVAGLSATSAAAATSPVVSRPATAFTADGLPTVQIDGIVWTQAINGNTVYAGGQFSNARPAGAAAGTNLTPRGNLLSYDITTGNLNTAFAPSLNGTVKALAVSPDGTRLYVGGAFTTANGLNRYRIVAYDTASGAVISSFAPNLNATVSAIVATNSTVYVGGLFGVANGQNRSRLAAFRASDGALTAWAPSADASVTSMVMTPDQSKLVIGGSFQNLNNQLNVGVGAVTASDGTAVSWPVNTVIQNGNAQAGIYSLSTDNDTIYGTNYNFGTGNYEGLFAMNQDGSIKWLADCHGDTYAAFSVNNVVYGAGHSHFCGNIGAFPEQSPRWENRLMAYTKAATGTVLPNGQGGAGYGNFAGQPSPSVIDYFPAFTVGSVSGQSQAVWSLTGNGTYLAAGGEFPSVNGKGQQGLVRFTVPSNAPNKIGPQDLGGTTNPTVAAIGGYGARVSWKLNWDRDDDTLTYKVIRSDKPNSPLYTTSLLSYYWQRPIVSFVDRTAQAGQTYRYRIVVSDPNGNSTQSDYISVTMPTVSLSSYAQTVLDDGASNYWRLGDANQATLSDLAGGNGMTKGSGVNPVSNGAINGDSDGAASYDGTSNGVSGAATAVPGPTTFSAEVWFNTTSTAGGKLLGFGDSSTGTSGSYDRHIYMDNAGHLTFGVYPNAVRTLTTPDTFNDGAWHQVVAELSPAGMALYVDGIQEGFDPSTTSAQGYTGYWRLGGDNLGGWPNAGSSQNFAGQLDEASIYPTALTVAQIRDHYAKSGRTVSLPSQPSDAYGAAVFNDNPTLYWRMDDANGPSVADSGVNRQPGVASGGVSFQTASPVSGSSGSAVTFNGSDGTIASQKSFSNPTTYSEELWFNTTTQSGGKLIGFGDQQSGYSGNYDRHVYMEDSGQLTFGVWTGQTNLITSPQSYNDGAWHHLVAEQGADGMKLYVDGVLVGVNPQTGAQGYTGYWRVGGDSDWGGSSAFFAGSIDEVAVYPVALTQAQVRAHFFASPAAVDAAPISSFTNSCADSACTFDGSASSDPDGTVSSYAWDFGDGSSASGATAQHTYGSSGTYQVKLTVTDDRGKSTASTQSVVVTVNQPPVSSFTSNCSERVCSFDASASADPDGSIASYAWDFGDNASDTGVSPSHTYSADGTYTVTLTVTDNQGKTTSVTHQVSAKANVKPTASFTTTADALAASFDASASMDPDGSIVSYAWDFGDNSTGSGQTTTHTYASPGSYQAVLTVTDNQGATGTVTKTVQVANANVPPTAAFVSSVSGLKVSVDGSSSTDSDGSVKSYAWNFGDGNTGTGSTTDHTYGKSGSYSIKLTVTDDAGATNSVTKTVSVTAPNVAPTAAFTTSTSQLTVNVDGSSSSDPDGSISSWAWDFGDQTSGTGKAASRTYTQAGTYSVTLTVTDDQGATNKITKTVVVSAGPTTIAADTFSRSGSSWGTADAGGAWKQSSSSIFSTNGSGGLMNLGVGASATASLDSVSSRDTTVVADLSINKVPSSGAYSTLIARKSGNTFYSLKVRWMADGTLHLATARTVSGTETTIREVAISGATYGSGDVYRVKFVVSGSATSTLTGKIWKVSGNEPANAQITSTDTTSSLQSAGAVGIYGYLPASATNGPLALLVDNVLVTTP